MSDISMCENETCPKRAQCYRFTAKPTPYRQAYGDFTPDERGECEYFWSNEGKE